jgi:hypothetical protein
MKQKSDLAAFLSSLLLLDYLPTFQKEKITMNEVEHLNEIDLKEMGLVLGERKKLMAAIQQRKN